MTIDVSLIPQNRVENLISKLSEIENNIGNIVTDITNNVVHRIGDETISGEKTFQNNITAPNQIDYTNITNCITEIPQDIKLELNNGTLTLKAGSKVYVPNGFENDGTTKKFDVHIISSDKVIAYSSKFNDLVIVTDINDNSFIASKSYTVSGATQPTDISRRNIWYDTTTNTVKTNSPSTSNFETNKSLPIAIVNCIDINKFTISQVFNGFGYVGSTVFALPGVKGLIPNGRNADGSLRNIEFVNDRVKTFTASGSGYGLTYFLTPDYVINLAVVNTKAYAEKDTKLTTFDNNIGVWFDTKQNVMLQTDDSGTTWTRVNYVCFSYMFMTNAGHLDYLVSKTAFHALDYNDFSDLKNTVDTNDSNVVHKTGDETITGVKTFNDSNVITNKEFISLTSSPHGQFRAIAGNYGFFIRNDGNSTYFLLTNSNDQYGSWNSLRPLTIENASGKVIINNSVVSGFVKETWKSGTQWYRIWSDGWIEQGGYLSWNGAWTTLTFNRPFTTTNYYINGGGYRSDSSPYQCMIDFKDWGTSSCSVWSSDDTTSNPCVMKWYACGY